MLDVGGKEFIPSSSALIRDNQRLQFCMWRANPWIQLKAERQIQHLKELIRPLVCQATCPASPTPKLSAALLSVDTSEASCWKQRTRTCGQRSMRSISLEPGRLATPCSTSLMPPAPDCSGISTDWWRCSASSSGIAGQSACDLPVNRLRRKVPACGPRRSDFQAGSPTHSGAVYWQKANRRRRPSDVPQ